MKKTNKTAIFLILTFSISFLSAGCFYLLYNGKLNTSWGLIFATSYMFMPMVSAIIVEKLIYKGKIKEK